MLLVRHIIKDVVMILSYCEYGELIMVAEFNNPSLSMLPNLSLLAMVRASVRLGPCYRSMKEEPCPSFMSHVGTVPKWQYDAYLPESQ